MKLRINRFRFRLPLRISLSLTLKQMLKENQSLSKKEYKDFKRKMYKAIKTYKKKYGRITLVDIRSSDGEVVKIIL